MIEPFEILPLLTLNLDEILQVVTGYETTEKYAIEKSESEEQTIFNIHLVKLDQPYKADFTLDFNDEDCPRFSSYLPQGYSFGVYQQNHLVALAISEAIPWSNSLRIWEFHVKEDFHHKGIGRALMNHVVNKAIQDHFRIVFLETQNTNVNAIRFYRRMGYSLDALDLSHYTNQDVESGEVYFLMKRKLA